MEDTRSEGESDDDSRTAAFSAPHKSHASSTANSSPHSTGSRKTRRRQKRVEDTRDFVPLGGTASRSAEYLDPANPQDHLHSDEDRSSDVNSSDMDVKLGKNRLATGFSAPRPLPSAQSALDDVRPGGHDEAESTANDEPIEISSSDESMVESEDGGMIVNIDKDVRDDEQLDDSDSRDEGEVSSHQGDMHVSSPTQDATSTRLKLEDLNGEQLELQIKYALFNLDRSQIDLNRAVSCLFCLKQGHMAAECPENQCRKCNQEPSHPTRRCPTMARCSKCREPGHNRDGCQSGLRVTTVPCDLCGGLAHTEEACPQRFFPSTSLKLAEGGPVRLWISCCICASKGHLVGDCPDADRSAASRWSLKSLASGEYINMNLETGAKSREIEAENRNMRPAGLQIKGRAGIHHASRSDKMAISDEEDEFFRAPVRRGNASKAAPQMRFGGAANRTNEASRHERYNAFDDRDSQGRGRGDWYGTDSFGRRRSRSPRASGGDQWRPDNRHPNSPRRFDGHPQIRPRSPPRGTKSIDSYRPDERPPTKGGPGASNSRSQSSRNPSFDSVALPTRKGSNPNLPAKPSVSEPVPSQAKKQKSSGPSGGKKKGKKGNTKP